MSQISKAILSTLLEEITDYESISLTEGQYERLEALCDQWEDRDSIEMEINRFLIKCKFKYDEDKCIWSITYYMTKNNFLDFYFNTGADGDQRQMRVDIGYELVNALLEGKPYVVPTAESLFEGCGYISCRYIEDYESYGLHSDDEFECFDDIKLI